MPVETAIANLLAVAGVVDTRIGQLKPLLADLETAEAAARHALANARIPMPDHLAGGANLKSLALSIAGNSTAARGRTLAEWVENGWASARAEAEKRKV